MFSILLNSASFLAFACFGAGIGALGKVMFGGWLAICAFYAAAIVIIALFVYASDLLDGLAFSAVARLANASSAMAVADKERRKGRSWLLSGLCAGVALGAIVQPAALLKLLNTIK